MKYALYEKRNYALRKTNSVIIYLFTFGPIISNGASIAVIVSMSQGGRKESVKSIPIPTYQDDNLQPTFRLVWINK